MNRNRKISAKRRARQSFNIVSLTTGESTVWMGIEPILPVHSSVAIDTMLNFNGHCGGDGHGVGTHKSLV